MRFSEDQEAHHSGLSSCSQGKGGDGDSVGVDTTTSSEEVAAALRRGHSEDRARVSRLFYLQLYSSVLNAEKLAEKKRLKEARKRREAHSTTVKKLKPLEILSQVRRIFLWWFTSDFGGGVLVCATKMMTQDYGLDCTI